MDRHSVESSGEPQLGFLSITETLSHGVIGGFLILNRLGHPLEFHCTAPVRPNKAQEILYGRSLKPFLCGHQIAGALYKRGKAATFALLTDSPYVLSFQEALDIPLMMIFPAESTGSEAGENDAKGGAGLAPLRSLPGIDWEQWREERRGGLLFAVSKKGENDPRRESVWENVALFQKSIDLTEPFERIRLAIKESQRGG